ncbi:ABC transporter permease [Intestinibacter sp.]|uniref:ABC transporter permease n=1 Tax=Intestinibacter sp. TaxID=1965304 RepID=UPI003F17C169
MEIWEVVQIVGRSLYVTVTATLIAMLLGIILSIIIYLKDFKLKKQLMLIVNALMSTPPVVMGLVVFLMLSKKGPLGSFELLFTCPAMIIAQVLLLIPMSISLIVDALNKCGEDILITCKILQVEKFQQKWIFFKELKSYLATILITVFGRGISEVGAVMLVGGNIRGKTRVMTTYISQSTSMGNFGNSLIIAAILLTISFASTFIIRRLQKDL